MANAVYPKALEGFAGGDIDWDADDIRAILVDLADYTYNAAHDFLDDVPSGSRVAVSTALTGKTKTLGVMDANDTTITSVTGDPAEAVIVYKHTGTEGTSRLISFHDQDGLAAGLSLTPDGGNVVIVWHTSGILSI